MSQSSAAATVLRDVAIRNESRTLKRPMASSPKQEAVAILEPAPLPPRAIASSSAFSQGVPNSGAAQSPTAELEQQVDVQAALQTNIDLAKQKGFQQGFDEGKVEGHQQGFKQGREKGLVEGRQIGEREAKSAARAGQEALAKRIEYLDRLFAALPVQIQERIEACIAASEDDMVVLCYTVICRLLGEKAFTRESVAHTVRQAIIQCCGTGGGLKFSEPLSVHVHPQDLELLQKDAGLSAWLEQRGASTVPWVPDETVGLGGCIVHGARGSLDARLETQLAALQELLLQGRLLSDEQTPRMPEQHGESS